MRFIINDKVNKQTSKLSEKLSDFIPFELKFVVENNKLICLVNDGIDKLVDLSLFTFNDSSKVSEIINNTIELIRYYYL